MKRKTWISILALTIIVFISLIGEQFGAYGSWLDAFITVIIKMIPVALFFILAVVARSRKGNYIRFWKGLSYVAFAFTVLIMLAAFSYPFMHYFNVIANQDKVKSNVQLIIDDTNTMFDEYKSQVVPRVNSYKSQLHAAIKEYEYLSPESILKKSFPTEQNWDKDFADNTVLQWRDVTMLKNWKANKAVKDKKMPEFKDALVKNFAVFSAAKQLHQLILQYDNYKSMLAADFEHTTPFEELDNVDQFFKAKPEFVFKNQEDEWRDAERVFTEMSFSFPSFLLFLILLILASSSYVFIKDSAVKAPRKNSGDTSVYKLGHQL